MKELEGEVKEGVKEVVSYRSILFKEYTWKDLTLTGFKWVKYLEITNNTFVSRIKKYGINDPRTYMTKSEMFSQIKLNQINKSGKFKADKKVLCRKLTIQELCHSEQQIAIRRLIAYLIKDAKYRIKKKDKKLYFDCKRWLLNGNGGLVNLLDPVIEIDTKTALLELKNWVIKNTESVRCNEKCN